MQSLNNFTDFQLNNQETNNINGGQGNGLGRSRKHGRFGKENIQFIYNAEMPSKKRFSDYAAFDFTNFESTNNDIGVKTLPEFTSDDLPPQQVIL